MYYYLKKIQNDIYDTKKDNIHSYICLLDIGNICIHIPSIEKQLEIVRNIYKKNNEIKNLKEKINKVNNEIYEII